MEMIVDLPEGVQTYAIVRIPNGYVLQGSGGESKSHTTIAINALEKHIGVRGAVRKVGVLHRGGGTIGLYKRDGLISVTGESGEYGHPPEALLRLLLDPFAKKHGCELKIDLEGKPDRFVSDLWQCDKEELGIELS